MAPTSPPKPEDDDGTTVAYSTTQGTITKAEDDEWLAWAAAKVAEEDNFAQPHGKRPKKPIRLQHSMKPLVRRRKKNKMARDARRRNRH